MIENMKIHLKSWDTFAKFKLNPNYIECSNKISAKMLEKVTFWTPGLNSN